MEVEHAVKVFPLNAELENNIKQMTAEGWLLLPGMTPVAIYHCVRVKAQDNDGNNLQSHSDGHVPVARIAIDETKVQILRNGELING